MPFELSYFPFYAPDWLSDFKVRSLTNAQKGIYIDLLCHQWMNGFLPNHVGNLLKICTDRAGTRSKRDLEKRDLQHVLNTFFRQLDDTKPTEIGNLRMNRDRVKQMQTHDLRVKAGKKKA